jgi:cytochrome c oxidase subunit 2
MIENHRRGLWRPPTPTSRATRVAVIVVTGLLAGCGGPASTLAPQGLGAARIATLTWILFAVGAAVYLLVLGILWYAVARRRPPGDPRPLSEGDDRPGLVDRRGRIVVILGGVVLPLLVIPVLFVLSVRTLGQLVGEPRSGLVVEVFAQQYWWEMRYPGPDGSGTVTTANELHVPVGRTVEVRLHSIDVIHSFWVPTLQGKLDAIPGKTNVTWIRAERAGAFPGQCAEYCGMQHALMRLLVVAQPDEEFGRWLRDQARPAAAPSDPQARRGSDLFLVHCSRCHAIRGTPAFFGLGGPDLTHVASRRTLAAGTFPNVKGNLAGWIADPQTLKPGNRMPRIPLPADDFHAVLEYVGSLR